MNLAYLHSGRRSLLYLPKFAMVLMWLSWQGLWIARVDKCAAAEIQRVDFSRQILPILSDHCFQCHGPDTKSREGELRLDTSDGALQRPNPVILPGDSAQSLLMQRITAADPEQLMPPTSSKRPLSPEQINLLRQWIDEGAAWGRHWAFEPPRRPTVVAPSSSPLVIRNPIDALVLARLAREGILPSPEADRESLIRRVTLDLTGLPPTPDEVDAFLASSDADAYEQVVDRLLGSTRFGERMVWEWLDAARYADTNGYQGDPTRTMYFWRDWVIQALNDNMPFDQFTLEQLAGDLLPSPTESQLIATGFHRNHMINGEGGRIAEESRVDYVQDRVETTGAVWLGLTLNCCRCHDHKFDPLKQREYYQLAAYFNSIDETGGNDAGGLAQPVLELSSEAAEKQRTMIMRDRAEARPTFILQRGAYDKPAEEVTHGVPGCLPPLPAAAPPNRLALARWLVSTEQPLTARVVVNRYWQSLFGVGLVKTAEDFGIQGEKPLHPELLDWLACEFMQPTITQPTVAHQGNGTPAWNVKHILRLIVTSSIYRQSSQLAPGMAERDPDNRWLARGPRFRMPSWMIRDQALACSGLLVEKLGGPPVKGYQPAGVWEEASFGNITYQPDQGEALYRRSLYQFWRRIVGPTMFFDVANRQTCQVKQSRTNTPLHALTTLNDVTYVEAARALAQKLLLHDSSAAPAERISWAYRWVVVRRPTAAEQQLLLATLSDLQQQFQADPEAARKLLAVGASRRDERLDPVEHAAYTALCSLILNLDEALTKQ